MLIAIDYDETYTADPEFWKRVVLEAKDRGHRVICVTSRTYQEGEPNEVAIDLGSICGMEVVFTAGERKRLFAERCGYRPHVWIDDCPESICASCDFRDREEALC